ncbi:4Fe-4S dicluster domain-containing protein [Candidatus Bathyarchaeota archaeon]|nr:4Fe-4S dicluster domain-containing protein [Candidatus Bathyarchaeota archaeon]
MEDELIGNLMKKPITLRFPYERAQPVERTRGKVTWKIEKCIGCTLCAKICPSEAVELIGKGRNAEIRYRVGRCLFCGECVDICPTKAIQTTKEFELAFTQPKDMILEFRRTKRESESSREE